ESPLAIREPYITIAGQTAPGDGICISRYPLTIHADQVIIRHLRLRLGDEAGEAVDALSARFVKNVIIDHVSASWSVDETLSLYHCDSLTVQWCLISESLYNSAHEKGNHGYGAIWGGDHSTYHHNLLAHHSSRNPRFASGSMLTDFRNNVIYNWGFNSAYGGEEVERGREDLFNFTTINMVANYFKPGPATQPGRISYRIINPTSRHTEEDYGRWYVADNVMEGHVIVTRNNWAGGVQPQDGDEYLDLIRVDEAFAGTMPIEPQTAEAAYASVLEKAGATLPRRDTIDARIVAETRGGTATYEGATYRRDHRLADRESEAPCGILDTQADVGGWPDYASTPPPVDTDHDGMPDEWEDGQGLDKDDPADGNQVTDGGYTMLEVYLNSL
ncbi:MAG: pectate lyase, partial [Lewinella sp.]|nr:pectate lyase [Lewinella sp.]